MKDRLPPYDEAAEKAIIGCCLTDPATCLAEAGLIITAPAFFYDARCRALWLAMASLEPHEVNSITISGRMGQAMDRAKATALCLECQDTAFSTANLPVWLEAAQGKFLLRKLIQVASDGINAAYQTESVDATLDYFEQAALKIRPVKQASGSIREIVKEAMAEIQDRFERQGTISGLSTGLVDLDMESDGLHGGEVVVIAAFPSFGKTALAMNIVEHVALDLKKPVGVFSAEMSSKSLAIRSICSRGRVNMRDVRDGRLNEGDFPKILRAAESLAGSNLVLDDTCGLNTSQLRQRARWMKQSHGIELLVADYAQLFSSNGAENRTNEVDQVSKCFKSIAKELNIPVILLSQLTDTGNGGIKTKNASAIEEDADGLWLLKRPKDATDSAEDAACAMELWLKKQRNGPRNVCIKLTFLKPYTRFEIAPPDYVNDYHEPHND